MVTALRPRTTPIVHGSGDGLKPLIVGVRAALVAGGLLSRAASLCRPQPGPSQAHRQTIKTNEP